MGLCIHAFDIFTNQTSKSLLMDYFTTSGRTSGGDNALGLSMLSHTKMVAVYEPAF